MNRRMLIVVGILIVAGLFFYAIGSGSQDDEAGRFADADSCEELFQAFEAEPVSDDAAERAAVGDEYRARFRQLGCS